VCKCYWIVLYTLHVTAFRFGEGTFFQTRLRHIDSAVFDNIALIKLISVSNFPLRVTAVLSRFRQIPLCYHLHSQ